ncbi:hypothetical protein KXD40_001625 [Peronospora effusa]|nr:hypothetical protein KXD40_001625 [Peronospora effusa]CAI5712725.1 unnamed protein product [Peronospora effusa]
MISSEILGKFQRLWAASMFIWSVSKPIVSKQNRDEASDLFGRMLVGVVLGLDRGHGCEVFNLGRGTPVLLADFISIIEGLVGKKAKINILPDQPGDVLRTSADISKAERLFGYKPTTPLEQGLATTWNWHSKFYNTKTKEPMTEQA